MAPIRETGAMAGCKSVPTIPWLHIMCPAAPDTWRSCAADPYLHDPVSETGSRRQAGEESLVISSTGRTVEGVSMPFIRWNSRSTSVSLITATSCRTVVSDGRI